MKNSNRFIYRFVIFIFLLFTISISSDAQAEEFCKTRGVVGAIGVIPPNGGTNNNSSNTSGSYYIKVYVHVIRKQDGTGGQTDEAIRNAFERLNSDFNPHDIFFVRECDEVNNILLPDEDYFDFNIYCDLWGNPDFQHDDGIDIFFGSDEISNNAGGIAKNIPSNAFWIGGIWNVGTLPIPTLISPVISHEMGHCLGLWHTHHGTVTEVGDDCNGNPIEGPEQCCELVNGSNSSTCGDFVQDTPADPQLWAT